jgi:hypothetical protein
MTELPCIGNDVIDLSGNNADRWKDVRKLSKTFTAFELEMIRLNPLLPVKDILYCCKESAYKHFVKRGRIKAFCPHSFDVRLTTHEQAESGEWQFTGTTHCDAGSCNVNVSFIPGSHVHSVSMAAEGSFYRQILHHREPGDTTSLSSSARALVLRLLESTFETLLPGASITNEPRTCIPFVQMDDKRLAYDISFSHDGSFIAGTVSHPNS